MLEVLVGLLLRVFTLKYPLRNQYNTRVYHILTIWSFLMKLFCFLFYYLIKRL